MTVAPLNGGGAGGTDAGATAGKILGREITVQFAGVTALDQVDIELSEGEIVGLIGPNGAGKTTLVNVLAGLQVPSSGSIEIAGVDVSDKGVGARAALGVARTFQGGRLFPNLSVFENVLAAAVASPSSRGDDDFVWDLLDRFGLTARAAEPAGGLPHGEERLVGLARALAMNPRWILLDEPAAGLNDDETEDLREVLAELAGSLRLGMLIIEHDMGLIMRLCQRVQVLNYGKTLANGTPAEVQADASVLEAYLGTAVED